MFNVFFVRSLVCSTFQSKPFAIKIDCIECTVHTHIGHIVHEGEKLCVLSEKLHSQIKQHRLKPGTCINKINRIIHTNSIHCIAFCCAVNTYTHTSVLSNKIIKAVKNLLCHVLLIGIIKCNPYIHTHIHDTGTNRMLQHSIIQ